MSTVPKTVSCGQVRLFSRVISRSVNWRAYRRSAICQLVQKAAAFGFTETGEMKEAMPFHGEMSDSVFMDFSILAKAGKVTGEKKYFDMAARHFAFMQKLVQRPDGLFRHSPLTDAAWGRGNGFPAPLGLRFDLGLS